MIVEPEPKEWTLNRKRAINVRMVKEKVIMDEKVEEKNGSSSSKRIKLYSGRSGVGFRRAGRSASFGF